MYGEIINPHDCIEDAYITRLPRVDHTYGYTSGYKIKWPDTPHQR